MFLIGTAGAAMSLFYLQLDEAIKLIINIKFLVEIYK